MQINILFASIVCIILIDNYVLSKVFRLESLFDVAKKPGTALGIGVAVTAVMGVISFITFFLYENIFSLPFDVIFRIIFSSLLIILLERLVRTVIIKFYTALDEIIRVFLRHLSLVSIMLIIFISIANIESGFRVVHFGLLKSLIMGIVPGVCFTILLLLMLGIKERLELAEIPAYTKSSLLLLITACFLILGFLGFSGIKI